MEIFGKITKEPYFYQPCPSQPKQILILKMHVLEKVCSTFEKLLNCKLTQVTVCNLQSLEDTLPKLAENIVNIWLAN